MGRAWRYVCRLRGYLYLRDFVVVCEVLFHGYCCIQAAFFALSNFCPALSESIVSAQLSALLFDRSRVRHLGRRGLSLGRNRADCSATHDLLYQLLYQLLYHSFRHHLRSYLRTALRTHRGHYLRAPSPFPRTQTNSRALLQAFSYNKASRYPPRSDDATFPFRLHKDLIHMRRDVRSRYSFIESDHSTVDFAMYNEL